MHNGGGIFSLNSLHAQDSEALQRNQSGDYVIPNNKLGIGTSNPKGMLDVNGRLNISGEDGKIIFPDGSIQRTAGLTGTGGENTKFDNIQTNHLKVGENSLHMWNCTQHLSSAFEPNPPSFPVSYITSTNGPLMINSRSVFINHAQCQLSENHQDVYINSTPSTGKLAIGLYHDTPPTHKMHLHGQFRIDTLLTTIAADKLVIANEDGVLGSRDFTGDPDDVLRGDGTWGAVAEADDPNAWKLTGNAGTTGNFLGTTNSTPLEVRTNNVTRFTMDHRMDASGLSSVNFGTNSVANGQNAFAIGEWADAEDNSVAIGKEAHTFSENSIAIGINAGTASDLAMALGVEAHVGGNSWGNLSPRGMAIGYNTMVSEAPHAMIVGSGVPLGQGFGFTNEIPNTLMLGSAVSGPNPAITVLANTTNGTTPGRVGIGLTNPVQQLHVDGDMNLHTTDQGYRIANFRVLATHTENTLVGRSGNPTGQGNTLVGFNAGINTTTNNVNTFVGHHAGFNNTTGHSNTFIGTGAGWSRLYNGIWLHTNNNAISSTLLGRSTVVHGANRTFATAIGSQAVVQASNTIALGRGPSTESGNGDHTVCGYTAMPVPGTPLIGSAGSFDRLGVNGNIIMAGALYQASDERVKKDFAEIEDALSLLSMLNPLTYEYDSTATLATVRRTATASGDSAAAVAVEDKHCFPKGRQMGFKAQEVAEVLPWAVKSGTDTTIAFLNQTALIPLLTKALKEQNENVAAQEEKLQMQAVQMSELATRMEKLEIALSACCKANAGEHEDDTLGTLQNFLNEEEGSERKATGEMPRLEQNEPNPFNQSTQIRYYVPQKVQQAVIILTDPNGKVVQTHLCQKGAQTWKITAGSLSMGIYTYTLLVDGNAVASKKMVITN